MNRKYLQHSSLFAGLLAATILGRVAETSAQDAGSFRGGSAHPGLYSAPAITGEPKLLWRFQTKGRIVSSPAIADGVVYVGSTDHYFYAIDERTGAEIWKLKTGSRISSSALVSGGLVYFESYDGQFYAVDKSNGAVKWKFAIPGERRFAAPHIHGALPAAEIMPDPFDVFLSSPAIWHDTVYFGSGDNNIYALDAGSGALKWKFRTGNVVHASPALADGMLYIGSWDHFFYALDAASGTLRWKYETGTDNDIHNQEGIQSSAVVADGAVYFGCRDANLYALEAHSGKLLWKYNNNGSWVVGSPAISGDRLYWATSDGGTFHASDPRTGKDRFTIDFKHWPMFSSPAAVGDMVYLGSHTGSLYAIDAKENRIAWKFDTDNAKRNGPALTNADGTPNYRAVTSDSFYDSMLVATDRMMATGAILSSPAVASDGTILFGSMDGALYALTGDKRHA
jgi:eukaryotic-like serine/threonine-protein kinase